MSKPVSDKKNFKKSKAAPLTAEEQAQIRADLAKRQAEEKAERERIEVYGKSVPKMSHRQLRGELVRAIKREHAGRPPEPIAGLTIAWSTVLLAVLDNTKTVVGKHTRPDQVNPWGKLDSYPR